MDELCRWAIAALVSACLVGGVILMAYTAVKHHEAAYRARRKRYGVKEPTDGRS
jgi:hypothetical protein